MSDFTQVKEGDTVTRMLAGQVPMKLRVSKVDEKLIYCGGEGGWTFDRVSGAEIDDYLQWGPEYGQTGSYLVDD